MALRLNCLTKLKINKFESLIIKNRALSTNVESNPEKPLWKIHKVRHNRPIIQKQRLTNSEHEQKAKERGLEFRTVVSW